MRRPPPLSEIASYPVTAVTAALATAVTAAHHLRDASIEALVMGPEAVGREPWRLVTSILPHGDALHLIFNVYWLWVFGTLVERVLGHAALLLLIVFFAVGSGAAEYATFVGGIGLSGVGYGLLGLLWALERRDRRFVDAVDARTTQLFFFWFLFCIALTVTDVQPIANVAHGVGGVLGVLVGQTLGRKGVDRLGWLAGACALAGLSVAGAGPLRQHVNLTENLGLDGERRGQEAAYEGYQAMEAGRVDEAERQYERAVALRPEEASYWFNLGITYEAKGADGKAKDAFERAAVLEPTESRYRDARATLGCRRGFAAYGAGQCEVAIPWLEDCRAHGSREGVDEALSSCRSIEGAPSAP